MALRTKPKLTIGLLLAGTLAVMGGGAYAATRPAPIRMMTLTAMAHPAHPRATSTRAATATPPTQPTTSGRVATRHAPAVARTPAPSVSHRTTQRRSITYVVKPGDTLSGIAEWFKQHGFGALYKANRAVIGGNPDLIRPGEHITIAHGVMTMFSSK